MKNAFLNFSSFRPVVRKPEQLEAVEQEKRSRFADVGVSVLPSCRIRALVPDCIGATQDGPERLVEPPRAPPKCLLGKDLGRFSKVFKSFRYFAFLIPFDALPCISDLSVWLGSSAATQKRVARITKSKLFGTLTIQSKRRLDKRGMRKAQNRSGRPAEKECDKPEGFRAQQAQHVLSCNPLLASACKRRRASFLLRKFNRFDSDRNE